MGKICTFFGHRELYQDISAQLEQAITFAIHQGYDIFWCGGYGAFDLNAAGTVQRLKRIYPHIQVVLILAYLPTHPIADIYDHSIYPEGIEIGPPRFAINRRNQWIIKNCDSAICYVNHTYGGAYTAYQTLKRQSKLLFNIGKLSSEA